MSWYLLPTKHKKELSFALHRLQNGAVLTIGPLAQLDFDTGANVSIKLLQKKKNQCNSIFQRAQFHSS